MMNQAVQNRLIDQLRREVNALTRRVDRVGRWHVEGGEFSGSPGGPFSLVVSPPAAGTTVERHPFMVTRADDGAALKVRVRPGTINSIVPSNIFTSLDITGSGLELVVLTLSSSSGSPSSAVLSIETSTPVPSLTTPDTPPTACRDVIAVLNDGAIYQVRETNLTASSALVMTQSVWSMDNEAYEEQNYYRWEVAPSGGA